MSVPLALAERCEYRDVPVKGRRMLRSLSDKVQLCYERAAEAKERAEEASDLEAKADFLTMEKRWLLLARSYQFSESLDDFTRWSSSRRFDLAGKVSESAAGAAAKNFDPADVTPIHGHETDVAAILANTPFLLTRCSSDLRYLFVSEAYARMLGRRREDFDGRLIVDIMGEKGFVTILPHVERVLRGEAVEYQTDVHFRGAGPRQLLVKYVPDRAKSGSIRGWIASILDLTDQKKADAQIATDSQAMPILRDWRPFAMVAGRSGIEPGSEGPQVPRRRRLSAERRRALELLASSPSGMTEVGLFAHGVNHHMLGRLLRNGLATLKRETMNAVDDRTIEIGLIMITDAGRREFER